MSTDRQEPVAGQLSAEQEDIELSASDYRPFDDIPDEVINEVPVKELRLICDAALSSLRGTFADGRADGIEAAVKAVYAIRNRRFDDVVYQEAWWDACDIAEGKIRALAQGQRSPKQGMPAELSQTQVADSDHPTEQDADELLREVLDWGLPDDLKQRIDAHLSPKEPT